MTSRALALIAILATLGMSSAAMAQQPAPETPASSTKDDNAFKLPVSHDRIRAGLAQPAPAEPLKGLNDPPPTFKVEIQEQQKFDDFLSKLKFDKGGPPIPGGIDAYE